MRNLLIILGIFLTSLQVYGQQPRYIYHEVKPGETVYGISRKYDVPIAELEKFNPDLKRGLKDKMLLLIPRTAEEINQAQAAKENKFVKHEVKSGETLYSISRKYGVGVEDLKKINPELKVGLKAGQLLLIPPTLPASKQSTPEGDYKVHKVGEGQTLYSIALRYGVSMDDIKKANPGLDETGLRTGDSIRIPEKDSSLATDNREYTNNTTTQNSKPDGKSGEELVSSNQSSEFYYHEVKAGQTAYSLSRMYHLTLDELYSLNPGSERGLGLGQQLKLPADRAQYANPKPEKPQPKEELNSDAGAKSSETETVSGDFFLYQVKPGDSFYSLKDRFGVGNEELIKYNPELVNGLRVDKYVIIPTKEEEVEVRWIDKVFADNKPQETSSKPSQRKISRKDSLNGEKPKTLAADLDEIDLPDPDRSVKVGVLLPFMARLDTSFQFDDEVPQRSYYVLDFYNGLLLAADTLAAQGMNLEMGVYDTRNSLFSIREKMPEIEDNDYDMIIGPLFQKNAHYVAEAFRREGTPVISPLSKTVELEDRPNLVKCVGGDLSGGQEIADILNNRFGDAKIIFTHGNSMADRQKVREVKARLMAREQQSFVESIFSTENMVDKVSLMDVLDPEDTNVVVVFSENKVLLSDLVAKLHSLKDYNITLLAPAKVLQIRTLELDYLNNLNLTMTDPSFIDFRDPATVDFIEKYRERYGQEPSQIAFQGYDVGLYFMNQLWIYGDKMLKYSTEEKQGLNTGFRLVRENSGGYQNQFVHITGIRDLTLVKIDTHHEEQSEVSAEGPKTE